MTGMPNPDRFVIACNPKEGTRLPFLLSLPVAGEGPVFLATSATWPADRDLYCHPVSEWPGEAEIIEEEEVQLCRRRGRAVDLVLHRRQRRRSMVVWTRNRQGRTLIFWRSAASMKGARPGVRVPQARALRQRLTVAVDNREKYAWKFADHRVELVKRSLPVGDYGMFAGDELIAAVERKKVDALATAAVTGRLTFTLQELSVLPFAAVVVEGRLSDLMKKEEVRSGWLLNLVAALQIQFHRITWMFAETRGIGEDYAYRWLSAAHKAYHSRAGTGEGTSPTDDDHIDEIRGIPIMDAYGRRSAAAAEALRGRTWTSREYADRFDVSRGTATNDLKELVKMGVLESRGSRRTRHYVASEDAEE